MVIALHTLKVVYVVSENAKHLTEQVIRGEKTDKKSPLATTTDALWLFLGDVVPEPDSTKSNNQCNKRNGSPSLRCIRSCYLSNVICNRRVKNENSSNYGD